MPRRSGRSGQTGEPRDFPHVGWREWLALPDLGVEAVKAKIDTGARSSAIHAFAVKVFNAPDGRTMVRFKLHPIQRNTDRTVAAEAELLEYRYVTSSGGQRTRRPVIVTHARLLGRTWPIELTLANRDAMGFRMLLGREAVRDRFLVDPGRSYLGGSPGVRDQGPGIRGQRSEVRGQRSEVRGQGSGVRSQGSGVRDQGAEVRGQESDLQGSDLQGADTRDQESGVGDGDE